MPVCGSAGQVGFMPGRLANISLNIRPEHLKCGKSIDVAGGPCLKKRPIPNFATGDLPAIPASVAVSVVQP
jgi:hypothetical protein